MNGLFIGLSTVDIVHYVDRDPEPNEKAAALSTRVFCGGPAANAAITFAKLGGHAELISWVGSHPLAAVIKGELANYGVVLHDLAEAAVSQRSEPPVTASVVVNVANGNRTVVGQKPQQRQPLRTALPEPSIRSDVVLIDSYFNAEARSLVAEAQSSRAPVVLDGGSWKESLPDVLPFVDYAICSERFRAPGCDSPHATARFLFEREVPAVAFTRGERPILLFERHAREAQDDNRHGFHSIDAREVPVPAVAAVRDTLAAGDIFHGAFCYHLVRDGGNLDALLIRAAEIAARSVEVYGPRDWQ